MPVYYWYFLIIRFIAVNKKYQLKWHSDKGLCVYNYPKITWKFRTV